MIPCTTRTHVLFKGRDEDELEQQRILRTYSCTLYGFCGKTKRLCVPSHGRSSARRSDMHRTAAIDKLQLLIIPELAGCQTTNNKIKSCSYQLLVAQRRVSLRVAQPADCANRAQRIFCTSTALTFHAFNLGVGVIFHCTHSAAIRDALAG